MLKFRIRYLVWTILLLLIEIVIALYVRDSFVRPYVGDFLVVILIYCFIRSFLDVSVMSTALFVLALSLGMEVLQYFNVAEKLGLTSRLARIVLGYSFEWLDLLAYTFGVLSIIIIEKLRSE